MRYMFLSYVHLVTVLYSSVPTSMWYRLQNAFASSAFISSTVQPHSDCMRS